MNEEHEAIHLGERKPYKKYNNNKLKSLLNIVEYNAGTKCLGKAAANNLTDQYLLYFEYQRECQQGNGCICWQPYKTEH